MYAFFWNWIKNDRYTRLKVDIESARLIMRKNPPLVFLIIRVL